MESLMTTTTHARDDKGPLAEHLASCTALLGPGYQLRCVAEAVHAIVAPRFVTTVCVSCIVLFSAAMAL
jgi:hypothetical protein